MLVHFGWIGAGAPVSALASVNTVRQAFPHLDVVLHEGDSVLPARWRDAIRRTPLPLRMLSDIQRHAILRRYGGLWLDVDVSVIVDPMQWTATFDRYTAIRMTDGGVFIGTDIIYAPMDWAGWDAIEDYIDRFLHDRPARFSALHLASRMIERLSAVRPNDFTILQPGSVFPMSPSAFSAGSVVARGFRRPAALPPRHRPGLGDMVKAGLSAVGITEERVSRAIGRPCGCGKRAEKLNELGHKYLGLPPGQTPPAT